MKDGDKNSKFFHGKAIQRRKTNEIKKLKDEQGVWRCGGAKVEEVLLSFFKELFATSNPTGIDQVCAVIQKKLSADHKEWWDQRFTNEEIRQVIDQMHPLKAPGPDGLPALFFQKFWHIVGRDIQELVLWNS